MKISTVLFFHFRKAHFKRKQNFGSSTQLLQLMALSENCCARIKSSTSIFTGTKRSLELVQNWYSPRKSRIWKLRICSDRSAAAARLARPSAPSAWPRDHDGTSEDIRCPFRCSAVRLSRSAAAQRRKHWNSAAKKQQSSASTQKCWPQNWHRCPPARPSSSWWRWCCCYWWRCWASTETYSSRSRSSRSWAFAYFCVYENT